MSQEPVRINKYLALQGITTRTGADKLIAAGKVKINRRLAKLGDKVLPTDTVEVVGTPPNYLYYAYNKPRGIITHSPQGEEQSIEHVLPKEIQGKGLFPVGRLDKDSHGLILLTNDGRVTKRLLDPTSEHEKEYVVKVARALPTDFKPRMESGVYIEGYVTKPAKVEMRGAKTFAITLTEGKKHQIRRMVAALGNEVVDLKRVRIGSIRLGSLGSGQCRELEGNAKEQFLRQLKLGASM